VFDVGGRRVRRIFEGEMSAGPHRLAWDGRDGSGQIMPAGKYFIRLRAEDSTRCRAVVRIR
jgi:flagellar hook assembly protein FlgD